MGQGAQRYHAWQLVPGGLSRYPSSTARGSQSIKYTRLTVNGIWGMPQKIGTGGHRCCRGRGVRTHERMRTKNALMRYDDAMRTEYKIHLDFARLSFPATMMST